MNELPPQQLADLWYLKFGHAWISRSTLDDDWRSIVSTLMKTNKIDYVLVTGSPAVFEEVYKLKESHADR